MGVNKPAELCQSQFLCMSFQVSCCLFRDISSQIVRLDDSEDIHEFLDFHHHFHPGPLFGLSLILQFSTTLNAILRSNSTSRLRIQFWILTTGQALSDWKFLMAICMAPKRRTKSQDSILFLRNSPHAITTALGGGFLSLTKSSQGFFNNGLRSTSSVLMYFCIYHFGGNTILQVSHQSRALNQTFILSILPDIFVLFFNRPPN